MFNKGFLCSKCGPIEKSSSKTINKVKHQVCPICSHVVQAWERPLNERVGRCANCGEARFTHAIWKSDILRKCKVCDEVYNIDTDEVKRKGKKELEYKGS